MQYKEVVQAQERRSNEQNNVMDVRDEVWDIAGVWRRGGHASEPHLSYVSLPHGDSRR